MFLKNYIYILLFLRISNGVFSQSSCSFFSTYFGGNQFDEIKSVCVDSNKNSYVIGNTYSTNLPVTPGLINDTASGNYDIYIAKFDSCGALIWSTYFGDLGYESAEKMELSNDGNIVFCGYTNSVNTPTTPGCFQSSNNGGYDCFITKINPNGTIMWSTFFGKSGGDFAFDLKIDAVDNVIIGGTSTSTNLYTTLSSFQPNHRGNTDAFVARFSKNGLLKWCTYYGGNGSEDIHALTVDLNCNIIGVGESFSSNLHISTGAFQSTNDGSSDTYIIKLDSNCVRVFSTYIGGSGSDDAWGLVCDSLNNIYVAGHTTSFDFDTTALAYQTIPNGGSDCYITKWSPTGTLMTSTLFGGLQNDNSCRLILFSSNQLLLLSETESQNLPVFPSSQQSLLSGSYDMYLVSLDANNLSPTWATYFGGSSSEDATDLKIIDKSHIIFCGSSNSTNYPVTPSSFQPTHNSGADGVITKLFIPNSNSTTIFEKTNSSLLEIYPNPFDDYLIIKSPTSFIVEIKNLFGQIVYSSKNNRYISTKEFKQGVYIVSVNSKSYRFIKQ